MATDSRTLKLAILGEVKGLTDSLKTGEKDVQSFGDKLEGFGKKAGIAFAAATAAAALYAGKLLKEGVESAIADEKAQASLAKTLENVTGATNNQIASVEDYILKTSLANGVTDDKLRPSLDRLVRSTQNVEEAQKLQTLALDIAAGSGKSLETVTEALAKATDGNTGALGRLGVGLDKSEIKTMSMNEITKKLGETFAGQASEKADTFAGKMDRLKIALDEAKESVGAALLPILEKLVGFITSSVLPKINAFVAGLTGKQGARDSLDETGQAAYDLGKAFGNMAVSVGKLFAVFNADENTGSTSGLAKVIGWAENVIKVFDKLIQGIAYTMGLIKVITNPKNWLLNADETVALANQYAGIAVSSAPKTAVNRSSTPMNINFPVGGTGGGTSGSGGTGGGSSISNAISSAVSSALPSNIKVQPMPNLSASEALFSTLTGTSGSFPTSITSGAYLESPRAQNVNITVNGAIDPISTARQINYLLGREATINGSFNNIGSSLLVAP